MRKEWGNGLWTAILAFGLWGLLPVYWKLFYGIPAGEILAHRIIWSFVFMLLLAGGSSIGKTVSADLRRLFSLPKTLTLAVVAAFLISANWFIYIWAVNDARILETSLGYYTNPLVNMLLGIVFLRERINRGQAVAILLAVAGVANLAIKLGSLPWVSLGLAFTMGFYSLCKKKAALNVFTGMTIETAVIAPFAAAYLIWLHYRGTMFLLGFDLLTGALLLCSGAITVIPLLLFANSANKLPMTVLGFTQYLSPTLTFLLGVFCYQEPFTNDHLISFALIWTALALFSLASRNGNE